MKDLTGLKFSRLLVLRRHPQNTPANKTRWVCLCDCGAETVAVGGGLLSGRKLSCGCLRNEKAAARNRSHGYLRGVPKGAGRGLPSTYGAWINMRQRCFNPKNPRYHDYGGRGITVCERWASFDNFLQDMGERPRKLTLDRIDNEGDYEPSNCKWSTVREQNNNQRLRKDSRKRKATLTRG